MYWNFSFVSIKDDENTLSPLVTVCGMSSLFVHTTVVPALTVNCFGTKEKLSMAAWIVSPAAAGVAVGVDSAGLED